MRTSKNIICTLLFVFCVQFTQAQIDFGIKGGVNIPTKLKTDLLSGSVDAKLEADNAFGFHGGVWLRVEIPLILSIRPEVLYTQVEYKLKGSKFKLQSLDIPILIEKKFVKFLSIHAGPNLRYNLSQNFDKENFKDMDSKDFNIGFTAGLGLDFGKFGIDARYVTNFSKRKFSFNEGLNRPTFNVTDTGDQFMFSLYYNFL